MIITVTPNTGLDRTLFITRFEHNTTLRASRAVTGMGGKGADASWILGELGIPSLALGFAAGANGRQMEAMLRARGVTTGFTWTAGETRLNTVVVCEDGSGSFTITAEGLQVAPGDVDALLERCRCALPEASCLVLGGSVPQGVDPGLYAELGNLAQAASVPVVLDASGAALRAGLAARPAVFKPNRAELEELAGAPAQDLEAAYRAARRVHETYGAAVVVTLGADGALAVLPGRAVYLSPLSVKVVSAAGAGDGFLAGIAAAFERGEPLEAGLRLGCAAASAVLLTPATADCRREDVERLLGEVRLEDWKDGRLGNW